MRRRLDARIFEVPQPAACVSYLRYEEMELRASESELHTHSRVDMAQPRRAARLQMVQDLTNRLQKRPSPLTQV